MSERNDSIIQAIIGGKTQAQVAREIGITRERIRQIWNKYSNKNYGNLRRSETTKRLHYYKSKHNLWKNRYALLSEKYRSLYMRFYNHQYTARKPIESSTELKKRIITYDKGKCKKCGLLISGEFLHNISTIDPALCYGCDGSVKIEETHSLLNSGVITDDH